MRKIFTLIMATMFYTVTIAQTTIPDGAKKHDYALSYKKSSYVSTTRATQIAIDGTDIYLYLVDE